MHGERFRSGRTASTASRPATGRESSSRSGAVPDVPRPLPWEELFVRASSAQQEELLALARRQGFLHSYQLPTVVNGNGAVPERCSPIFQQLAAGEVEHLEALALTELQVQDPELDEEQRGAVARALQTPDICLIQGAPASGKSRVVAELIAQAAERGEQVLVVSATSAATDRVLELVGDHDAVFAVRCVEPGEPPTSLPEWCRAFTLQERLARFSVGPLQAARNELWALEERCRRLGALQSEFEDLRQVAVLTAEVEARCLALNHAHTDVGHQVAQEFSTGGSLAESQREFIAAHEARSAELSRLERDVRERHEAVQKERSTLALAVKSLQPLAEAREHGRWWKLAWWRARFCQGVVADHARLQAQLMKLNADCEMLAEEERSLLCKRKDEDRTFDDERRRVLDLEIGRRRNELLVAEDGVRGQRESLREQWHASTTRIADAAYIPSEATPEAVDNARATWQCELKRCNEQRTWLLEWMRCLEETPEALARRLPAFVNLVCGTLTAFRADNQFGDRAQSPLSFDRLIVQDAERLTRGDFLHLAGRARRCVLVAESARGEQREAGRGGLSSIRGASAPTAFFDSLWQSLQGEPLRVPYTWMRCEGRLVCRLRALSAEQQTHLEREPVSDNPAIELRIHHTAYAEPMLAEIAFPSAFNVGEAKQYVFRELDEIAVTPADGEIRWTQDGDSVTLHFADRRGANTSTVVLAPGIREVFDAQSDHPCTYSLEFARAASWDLKRASEFVRRRLNLHNHGRTVSLTKSRRAGAELRTLIADLLSEECAASCHGTHALGTNACLNGCTSVVEFVSVARDRELGAGGPRSGGTRAAAKGGAGLEVDLSERGGGDRLPPELRGHLPARGLVNYAEACAVIRTLEKLCADVGNFGCNGTSTDSARSTVAVIALYAAQAALLRCLAERSPALRNRPFDLELGVAETFREREFHVVLVSLTRSHVHRAVAYGDGPRQLALALTRARGRIIMFGDPGTLARRCQWEGRLEQLTDAEAAGERAWACQLLRYLEGAGRHQLWFHFREGSPT